MRGLFNYFDLGVSFSLSAARRELHNSRCLAGEIVKEEQSYVAYRIGVIFIGGGIRYSRVCCGSKRTGRKHG